MGFDIGENYSNAIAKVVYTVWTFSRINSLRIYLVYRLFGISSVPKSSAQDKEMILTATNKASYARAGITNSVLDVVFLFLVGLSVLDVLKVKLGMALKSFFAVSSFSTILLSVASGDIAKQAVNGMALQASEKFFEGEKIQVSDTENNIIRGTIETLNSMIDIASSVIKLDRQKEKTRGLNKKIQRTVSRFQSLNKTTSLMLIAMQDQISRVIGTSEKDQNVGTFTQFFEQAKKVATELRMAFRDSQ